MVNDRGLLPLPNQYSGFGRGGGGYLELCSAASHDKTLFQSISVSLLLGGLDKGTPTF